MGVVCSYVRFFKNRHQKVMSSEGIGIRAQNMFTNLGLIVNLFERTYITILMSTRFFILRMTHPPEKYKSRYESYAIVPCR